MPEEARDDATVPLPGGVRRGIGGEVTGMATRTRGLAAALVATAVVTLVTGCSGDPDAGPSPADGPTTGASRRRSAFSTQSSAICGRTPSAALAAGLRPARVS